MYNNLLLPTGKYLGDVLTKLPANKIIYKHLTGCGATHLEIFCNRWSIIVEPYIPVILGKRWMEKKDINGVTILDEDHNPITILNPEVLAVYEKTSKDDIIDFLSVKRNKYKLITTPESLSKILAACEELAINPYESFFLLVDECEKLTQDAQFREDITVVMDSFFKFRNRSFVSATPLPPSDPRFIEYGFDDFYVNPENKSKIKIDLYATNNIASTLKNYFNSHRNEKYLIFLNSTERIASVIKFLKIESETQVFCARESSDTLRIAGILNTSTLWSKEKTKKYNFFTSRFFTAFDLKLDCKPNVLIISDVKKAAHSALDPNIDIIQIAGRARSGYNHLAHITNWDAKPTRDDVEIRAYIGGLREGYSLIEQLRDQCNNNHNIGTYDVLNEALKLCSYKNYLNKRTLAECPYLIDNEIQRNKVTAIYKNSDTILKAYNDTHRFDVKFIKEDYNLTDDSLDKLKSGLSKREKLKVICEMFATYFEQENSQFRLSPNYRLLDLMQTHSKLYQFYKVVGIETIRTLSYNTKKIEKQYNLKMIEGSDSFFNLTHTLMLIFKEGKSFHGAKIVNILRHYFTKYKIRLNPTVNQLRTWFDIPKNRVTLAYTADGREIKGYKIGKPKNHITLPNKFRQ